MLEGYSRTWGGDGSGLIACSPTWEIAEPFWRLAEVLDADHWAVFSRTGRGLQMVDPQAYEAQLTAQVKQWMEQSGTTDEDQAREMLEPQFLSGGGRPMAPDSLADQIRHRMAPLATAHVVVTGEYSADEPPGHGMVDMCGLTHQPARFTGIDLSGLPEAVQLLVAARTGMTAPGQLAQLRERGPVDQVSEPAGDLSALLRFAWTGQADTGASYSDPSFLADTPLAQSRLGCSWLTALSPDMDEPVVVICGDSAEDFCYAYTRRRVVAETYWLPIAEDVEDGGKELYGTLAQVLADKAPRAYGNRPVLLASLTLDEEQLQEVRERLLAATPWGRMLSPSSPWGAADVSVCAAMDLPVRRNLHLLDKVHFGDTMYEPFLGEDLARSVEIPLPSEAVGVTADACRWQVDIQDPGNVLPARWALRGIATADGTPAFGVRVSTAGISIDSHGRMFTFTGMPLSQRLAQVRGRFASAETVFTELAAARGATVERSDAGRRAAIAVEMWGSPETLAADLTGPARRLLDTFLPPKSTRDGDYVTGYAIRGDGYVALVDAAKTLNMNQFEARELFDRLLAIQVLRRGLLLSCARCHFEAFYRIEQVGSTFDCQACGHTSAMARGRWYKNDAEPHWYYAIDQVVRELLKQHGDVPFLATAKLKGAASSLLWSPELTVTDTSGPIELDICLVLDGKVIVGEAKSNNSLKAGHGTSEAATRLVYAAQLLSADQIVLATSMPAWAKGVRHAMDQAILDGWGRGPRPVITELVNVGTS